MEELNFVNPLTSSKNPEIINNPEAIRTPIFAIYFYRLNVKNRVLADIRVRRALYLSINRNYLCRKVLQGGEIPAFGFVPGRIPGYNNYQGEREDPDKARELLKEAGYPNGKGFPKLKILFNNLNEHKIIAIEIQKMWKEELNIDILLEETEFEEYRNRVFNLDYEIARSSWVGDYIDPSTFLDIFENEYGKNNRTGWFNPDYTRLLQEARKEMDLRISYSDDYKNSLKNIEDIIVKNDENHDIHIKDIGNFEKGRENGKIYRKNKRKTVKIGIYLGSISLSKAISKIKKALKNVPIKDGYYFDFGDILKKLKDSQTVGLFALFLSIFIIYCILAIQFESFVLPLLIIPIIPISCCFSILILFLLKMSLNLAVYIGLIILGGVVVNNTILLTEGFNNYKNINIYSIYRTVKTRIKPVYITTLTTIIALIPMIFQFGEGSELWRPLAITLASGLTFGTIVNLCFFPVLFMKKRSKTII